MPLSTVNVAVLVVYSGAVLLATALMTAWVRRYALRRLLDQPNARSSHSLATPRGGGLAIAISVTAGMGMLGYLEFVSPAIALALGLGSVVVALIGWWDDHRNLSPLTRLAVQCMAGIITSSSLALLVPLNLLQFALSLLILIWGVNLFNFMDGIDGIAAVQAICIALGMAILACFEGAFGFAALLFGVAGASAGFLYWNWPPARIFLGDVGSYYLGFMLAGGVVAGAYLFRIPLLTSAILVCLFVSDATYTLIARIVQRKNWVEAHRDHAYQQLTDLGFSHRAVSLGFAGLNVAVIWPLTFITYAWPSLAVVTAILTYLACLAGWAYLRILHTRRDRSNSS